MVYDNAGGTENMADLAKIDLATAFEERKIRALLEDRIDDLKGQYPDREVAIAVWYDKSPQKWEQKILVLWTGSRVNEIYVTPPNALMPRGTPTIHATTVADFTEFLASDPQRLQQYLQNFEALYYEQDLVTAPIIQKFNLRAEPTGLMKGWYVSAQEFANAPAPKLRNLLSRWGQARPVIGLVKVEESSDFGHCSGLLHMEFSFGAGPRWLPLSLGALATNSFYNDWLEGRPGYFLFRGGSLYQIQRIEEKTVPEYSSQVLERLPDDRYPEVYLRAVSPSE